MTEDAGRPTAGAPRPDARRPGRVVSTAVAVALLLGGGIAVAVGLTDQGATPAPPPLSAPAGDDVASAGPSVGPGPAAAVPGTSPAAPSTGVPSPAAPSTTAPSSGAPGGPAEEVTPVALPVSVSIPAIGVDSDLLHLGLDPDGSLQVPQGADFDRAAWFDGSPRPGEPGPAVIEGHVSSIDRGPSVFFELTRLQVGDRVEVTRADGSTATFEVYDLQQFPKDSFPTIQVYGNTAGPELRLITCGGTVAESTGRFVDNVIVFAREV